MAMHPPIQQLKMHSAQSNLMDALVMRLPRCLRRVAAPAVALGFLFGGLPVDFDGSNPLFPSSWSSSSSTSAFSTR